MTTAMLQTETQTVGWCCLSVRTDRAGAIQRQQPGIAAGVAVGPRGAAIVSAGSGDHYGSHVEVESTTIGGAIGRLENGLRVYDSSGQKVGRIYRYVAGTDWIVIEKGVFPFDFYVPVTAIEYLDGAGVHLRVPWDVLKNAFVLKPAHLTCNEMACMEKSPMVYDLDGLEVGRVSAYDPVNKWIMIKEGISFPQDLFIPVTVIDYLDGAGAHLRVARGCAQGCLFREAKQG